MRRIEAAYHRSKTNSLEEYLAKLRKNPEELKNLKQFFSINVTRFFRNQDTFEQLSRLYLPQLIAKKKNNGNNFLLNIWSVGCANGAEPYTLAIMLSQILGEPIAQINVKIIGSDINSEMLQVAEKGIYSVKSMEEVPKSILKQYFTKLPPELYQINHQIQKMVHFRYHDLLNDRPLMQQDLVVCRNVLIYFSRQSQGKLFDELTKSLKPHGLLILGRTEILPHHYRSKFTLMDTKHRIYQKNGDNEG